MGRPRSPTQPAPVFQVLRNRGISHERALLAVRVGTLRNERDWNWHDLAAHATPSLRTHQIERLEQGLSDPEFSTLVRIAWALELRSLDELLQAGPLDNPTRRAPAVESA